MDINRTAAQAERTIHVSLDAARQLPNMLGRIAPLMLKAHGYYTATVGGVKTLYVLTPRG